MIKKLLRLISNTLKPWSKGQRALWYQQRKLVKDIQGLNFSVLTIKNELSEIQLTQEAFNLATKPKRKPKKRKVDCKINHVALSNI